MRLSAFLLAAGLLCGAAPLGAQGTDRTGGQPCQWEEIQSGRGVRYWWCSTTDDRDAISGPNEGDIAYAQGDLSYYDGEAWTTMATSTTGLNDPAGMNFDAFGRLRTSAPYTLFESQSQYNASGLLWEDVLTAGGTSTHQSASSTVRLRVSTSGDKVVRQTRQYFRYRPGKSQFVAITFQSDSTSDADVRRRIGYFDASNGAFFEQVGTTLKFCVRNGGSDSCASQGSWNVDDLDGAGASGYTLNILKSQILLIDLQWLGVGRVRFGFDIDGKAVLAHQVLNANTVTATYMATANLPLRYEIEATGTVSTTHDLYAICATVQSEGGFESELGYPRGAGSATAISVTTRRNVLAIRPKATFNGIVNRGLIAFESAVQTATTNSAYCELIYNPTLGGSPSWTSAGTNSIVEYDVAGTTITGGDVLAGWFTIAGTGSARGIGGKDLSQRLPLTLDTAGANPIVLSVACTSFTGTASVTTAMNWRELW